MAGRRARRFDELTPEEKAKVEAFRTRHHTSEARAEEERARAAVREEFPPLQLDDDTRAALAALRAERERRGLSLADLAERTGMDKAMLSRLETGKIPNPTLSTLRVYAKALGRRLVWSTEDIRDPTR
jgi:ribosome-binding protein aMBF1 (putative translation factor)